MKKLLAEFFGTYWLVFGGCGSAIFAAGIPDLGIGFAGVSLAFGLTVLTMAYAVGHISGGHFNPPFLLDYGQEEDFQPKNYFPTLLLNVSERLQQQELYIQLLLEKQVLLLMPRKLEHLRLMVLVLFHQMGTLYKPPSLLNLF